MNMTTENGAENMNANRNLSFDGIPTMTRTVPVRPTVRAMVSNLSGLLAIAANERDGFGYDADVLARAATAPAGIVGR